jgi:hypothetical protein
LDPSAAEAWIVSCVGRARLSSDLSEIKIAFRIPPERPTPNIAPSWNVAPTDPLPIVHYDSKAGERSLDVMRWGLISYWAKDIKIGFSPINLRAEEVDAKPAFREAFQGPRYLVPLDNFYERKKTATGKRATRSLSPTQALWSHGAAPLPAGLKAPERGRGSARPFLRSKPFHRAGGPDWVEWVAICDAARPLVSPGSRARRCFGREMDA